MALAMALALTMKINIRISVAIFEMFGFCVGAYMCEGMV